MLLVDCFRLPHVVVGRSVALASLIGSIMKSEYFLWQGFEQIGSISFGTGGFCTEGWLKFEVSGVESRPAGVSWFVACWSEKLFPV